MKLSLKIGLVICFTFAIFGFMALLTYDFSKEIKSEQIIKDLIFSIVISLYSVLVAPVFLRWVQKKFDAKKGL